jgi:hypothetical protein
MLWRKLIAPFATEPSRISHYRMPSRAPEPPIGFIRRTDPQYYFLVRRSRG